RQCRQDRPHRRRQDLRRARREGRAHPHRRTGRSRHLIHGGQGSPRIFKSQYGRGIDIMANTPKDILKMIEEKEIEWVDLRFTDPKGKWQHLTMVSGVLGEDELTEGLMFDGSSIEGWKAI